MSMTKLFEIKYQLFYRNASLYCNYNKVIINYLYWIYMGY